MNITYSTINHSVNLIKSHNMLTYYRSRRPYKAKKAPNHNNERGFSLNIENEILISRQGNFILA